MSYNWIVENKIWIRIIIALLVAYIVFSVGKVLYQNYKVNKEVAALKVQVEELKKANKEYSDKILYYQSPSYREKIARERLGLQKEGESVVVILPEERPKETEQGPKDTSPNYLKWWNYFFKES